MQFSPSLRSLLLTSVLFRLCLSITPGVPAFDSNGENVQVTWAQDSADPALIGLIPADCISSSRGFVVIVKASAQTITFPWINSPSWQISQSKPCTIQIVDPTVSGKTLAISGEFSLPGHSVASDPPTPTSTSSSSTSAASTPVSSLISTSRAPNSSAVSISSVDTSLATTSGASISPTVSTSVAASSANVIGSTPSTTGTVTKGSTSLSVGAIIGAVIGSLSVAFLILCAIILFRRHHSQTPSISRGARLEYPTVIPQPYNIENRPSMGKRARLEQLRREMSQGQGQRGALQSSFQGSSSGYGGSTTGEGGVMDQMGRMEARIQELEHVSRQLDAPPTYSVTHTASSPLLP